MAVFPHYKEMTTLISAFLVFFTSSPVGQSCYAHALWTTWTDLVLEHSLRGELAHSTPGDILRKWGLYYMISYHISLTWPNERKMNIFPLTNVLKPTLWSILIHLSSSRFSLSTELGTWWRAINIYWIKLDIIKKYFSIHINISRML